MATNPQDKRMRWHRIKEKAKLFGTYLGMAIVIFFFIIGLYSTYFFFSSTKERRQQEKDWKKLQRNYAKITHELKNAKLSICSFVDKIKALKTDNTSFHAKYKREVAKNDSLQSLLNAKMKSGLQTVFKKSLRHKPFHQKKDPVICKCLIDPHPHYSY